MTIEKGQDWGTSGELPDGAPIVSTDAGLAALWPATEPESAVGLTGGDLCRTVGGRADETSLRDGKRTLLPIDVGTILLDGETRPFAAHVVRRRRWWSGTTIAVMNASFHGPWNASPRGHPNDGRLDVIEASLSAGDRWKARSRLPSGSHVPHPDITIRRLKRGTFVVGTGDLLLIDGVRVAFHGPVEWAVVPDAMTIAI